MEDRQNTGISKRKGSAHSVSQGIDISKGVSLQAFESVIPRVSLLWTLGYTQSNVLKTK